MKNVIGLLLVVGSFCVTANAKGSGGSRQPQQIGIEVGKEKMAAEKKCVESLILASMSSAQGQITAKNNSAPGQPTTPEQLQLTEDFLDLVTISAQQFCRNILK